MLFLLIQINFIGRMEVRVTPLRHVQIQMDLRLQKGMTYSNHCVSLDGRIDNESPKNFIYYFNRHLKNKFGITLSTFNLLKKEGLLKSIENEKIWNLNNHSMRSRFQQRAYEAGYPKKLFGIHSLRSGFLCSSLLQGKLRPGNSDNVMEPTAIVGHWKPYSKSQCKYIKRSLRGSIVANRLVDPNPSYDDHSMFSDEDLSSLPLIKDCLKVPGIFHGIELSNKRVDLSRNMDDFYNRLKRQLYNPSKTKKQNLKTYERKHTKVLLEIYNKIPDLANTFEQAFQEKYPEHLSTKDKCTAVKLCQIKQYIKDGMIHDINFADHIFSLTNIVQVKKIDREVVVVDFQGNLVPDHCYPRSEHTTCRDRTPWSEEEERILLAAVARKNKWKAISNLLRDAGYVRTNVDCKDKYRNILDLRKRNAESSQVLSALNFLLTSHLFLFLGLRFPTLGCSLFSLYEFLTIFPKFPFFLR